MIFEDQSVYCNEKNKCFPEIFCIKCQNGFKDTFKNLQNELSNNFSLFPLNDDYSIIFCINKKTKKIAFPDDLFANCSISSLFYTKDYVKSICNESTQLQPDLFYLSFQHLAKQEIVISKNDEYIFDHQIQIDGNQQTEFYGFREFKYLVLFFINVTNKFHIWPIGILYSDINYFSDARDEFHDELRSLNERDISNDSSFNMNCSLFNTEFDDSDQDFYELSIQEIENHDDIKIIDFVPNHSHAIDFHPINIHQKAEIEQYHKSIPVQHDSYFAEFNEQPNLVYCYFQENPETMIAYSKQTSEPIFGVTNAKDIQRSFYCPGTKRICTFIGFSDMNQLIDAIMNSDLKNVSINKHIEIYDKKKQKINEEEATVQSKQQETTNNEIDEKIEESSETDEEDNNIEYCNKFCPKENIYYLMVTDKCEKINDTLEELEDISYKDIQRNIKFDDSNKNYTFIGFELPEDRISAITKCFQKCGNFPHAVVIHDLVIDPKLNYIRFLENKPSCCTSDSIFASKEFYGLKDYSEIQRFAFHDNTVFTYVAFKDHDAATEALNYLKESENDKVECINIFSQN